MLSLGGSLSLTQGATDISQLSMVGQVRDWFCPLFTCVNTSTTHVYSRGLVSDLYTDGSQHLAFTIGERFNVSPPEVDFRLSGFAPVDATGEEVFLVRAVPLPAAVWLFGSGPAGADWRGAAQGASDVISTISFQEDVSCTGRSTAGSSVSIAENRV